MQNATNTKIKRNRNQRNQDLNDKHNKKHVEITRTKKKISNEQP